MKAGWAARVLAPHVAHPCARHRCLAGVALRQRGGCARATFIMSTRRWRCDASPPQGVTTNGRAASGAAPRFARRQCLSSPVPPRHDTGSTVDNRRPRYQSMVFVNPWLAVNPGVARSQPATKLAPATRPPNRAVTDSGATSSLAAYARLMRGRRRLDMYFRSTSRGAPLRRWGA